jgi:hypothetical protein
LDRLRHVRFTPGSDRTADITDRQLRADTVEKVFLGRLTKFSRAADAFRARWCEGPRRISEKRPRPFVLALRRIPTVELSKNQDLRDFWGRSIFDFFNSICHEPTWHRIYKIKDAEAAFIFQFEQNWTGGIAGSVHIHAMDPEGKTLSPEEFASLLTVGNTAVNSAAPMIPTAHSARLIALGYVVDLAGRLRMTTPGRVRIYAGQLANWGRPISMLQVPNGACQAVDKVLNPTVVAREFFQF